MVILTAVITQRAVTGAWGSVNITGAAVLELDHFPAKRALDGVRHHLLGPVSVADERLSGYDPGVSNCVQVYIYRHICHGYRGYYGY